jgi:hypothetical protein
MPIPANSRRLATAPGPSPGVGKNRKLGPQRDGTLEAGVNKSGEAR